MKGKTPKSKARGRGRGRGRTTGAADPSSSSHPVAMGTSDLTAQLEGVTLLRPSTRFQKLLETSSLPEPEEQQQQLQERDFILSQDFFCTPDYITPDAPQFTSCLEFDKENVCPKSPEKSTVARSKRYKRDLSPDAPQSANLASQYEPMEITLDASSKDGLDKSRSPMDDSQKKHSYVSESAVALRCRVMPPPCIKNPYLNVASLHVDAFCDRRSKLSGFSPSVGGDGLSRYRTDFHELEQIGYGNFSRVFKVLKRIDGCLYAVKQSIKQLHNETERRRALMEVQALAALGSHENIVAYYTSWFENEQLFIQMELCDHSLTIIKNQAPKCCSEVLEMLYQIAKALNFMHERGIAHLDIKPENIYAKSGTYKLGDFGCATLMDHSLGIEEGDARYMPNEMLKDQCEYLDKVDIFSLGAALYEILKGTPLPDSGPKFYSLREGKISLLPGYPVQFQNLLKAMMDPDPVKRPSAREILENPIFDKLCPGSKTQSKSKQ